MAGTNTARDLQINATAPAIILVRPQLGENIGMCARAMLNCAVTELRIVKPRDGWPNEAAVSAASGAVSVIENARIFETTAEAVADLELVFATTARNREIAKDVHTINDAATMIRARNAGGNQKCGILFGPERTGLENDDIALSNAILNIPLNPGFSSLNLAQAVLLTCHAWLSADNPFALTTPTIDENMTPATKGDIENLLTQLEQHLDAGGYFRSPEQRPTLLRNIRNYFFRSAPTVQEVRTMHGIFSSLLGKRGK